MEGKLKQMEAVVGQSEKKKPEIVHAHKSIDKSKLRKALRGEDLHTNILDPAITHSHSTFFYVVIYIVLFGGLILCVNAFCIKDPSTRYVIKHYLRKVRGKTNDK